MMKPLLIASSLAAFALTACHTMAQTPVPAQPISFIVIGDTPYGEADFPVLDQAVEKISGGDFPFVIHVGDYKGGGAECLPEHDDYHAELIKRLAPTPVFYTPGDNEWTDCDRFKHADTGENYSDLDRLDIVRSRFFGGQAPTDFGAVHQDGMQENARWSHDGAVFATLHVTGTNNGRNWVTGDPLPRAKTAVEARDKANTLWITETLKQAQSSDARAIVIAMQSDMTDIKEKYDDVECSGVSDKKAKCDGFTNLRRSIRDMALAFDGPVLLIHGDTSPFTLNQVFAGEDAPNLWRLNAAGDSGENKLTGQKWGTRDVTHVTIDTNNTMPFAAEGYLTGKMPKKK